jgi:hypothetical protein
MGLVVRVLDTTDATRSDVLSLRDQVRDHVAEEASWKADMLNRLSNISVRLDGHDGPVETVRRVSAAATIGPKVVGGLVVFLAACWGAVAALWGLFEWLSRRGG